MTRPLLGISILSWRLRLLRGINCSGRKGHFFRTLCYLPPRSQEFPCSESKGTVPSQSRLKSTTLIKLNFHTRAAMVVKTSAHLDSKSVTLPRLPAKLDTSVAVHLSPPNPDTNGEDLLVVSPSEELPHLLDLRTVDTANQLLAKALVGLKCLRVDYATAPYVETFNWPEVINSLKGMVSNSDFTWKEQFFYIVVFRSQIPPTTVYADLGVLDKAAHAEATKSGGFLK